MTEAKNRRLDIYCLIFLGTLVVIFFGRVIYSFQTLFGSDFILYFYPIKSFVADYVFADGKLPFWNPFQFSGIPFISNIQASMFYPLGLLFYLMPIGIAYLWTVVIHCICGSIFMYLFARSLSINRAGSLLAAVIFTYNGYFMAHLYAGHLSFVQNYIWIPLIFLCLLQFINTLRFKWAVLAGLTLGVQILGGFPQIAFYTILATLAFGLFRMVTALRVKAVGTVKHTGIGLGIMLTIGFSLAAIQLIPTLQFIELSGRSGGVPYWFAVSDSLHPAQLISLLIPDFFGNPLDNTYLLSPKDWHFWETCGYVGILPIGFLFMQTPKDSALRRTRLFFAALVIMSLFLALGKYNPIYPLIYRLPGFGSFRIPAQILFLFTFSISILSGMALHQLEHVGHSVSGLPKGLILFFIIGSLGAVFLFFSDYFADRLFQLFFMAMEGRPVADSLIAKVSEKTDAALNRFALFFFSGLLLFVFARKGNMKRPFFKVAVLALVVIDLGLYSAPFVKPYPLVFPEVKKEITRQLKKEAGLGRAVISGNFFTPNDALSYYFQAINGYDPLILGRYIMYLQASQNLPLVKEVLVSNFLQRYDHKFLRMLNLTHILGDQGITRVGFSLPRAFLVNRAIVKPATEILDFMKSDGFDPRTTVVLEPEHRSFLWPQTSTESLQGSCTITEYGYETIKMNCTSNQQCYLVMSEMHYPGWEATVDGKPAPVLRGNYLFRVIPLKQGKHEVEMRFVSRPFQAGMIISVFTLFGSAAFLLVVKKRTKRI